MPSTRIDEVIALTRRQGIVTARALREQGIAPAYLQRLTARGVLTRVAWGIYALTDGAEGADITAMHTLVEACLRVPSGVVCLLSALRFHNLTTQAPRAVWLAIDPKARLPQVPYPLLRFVRFGGTARTTGVEKHLVEGQEIHVYGVAKTVADCFKYRHKIGLDVAIEALNDAVARQARDGRRALARGTGGPRRKRDAPLSRGGAGVTANMAQSVRDRLLPRARERGEDFNFLLNRFAVERFLYRLSVSPHRDRFVLKGASLFAIWAAQFHRATRDIDLEGFGRNDPEAVGAMMRAVCAVAVDDDGLTLLPDDATAAAIRDEEQYGGVRIRIPARLGNAQIDVGFGDAITPPAAEVDYPTLLPFPAPRLRAYPRETVDTRARLHLRWGHPRGGDRRNFRASSHDPARRSTDRAHRRVRRGPGEAASVAGVPPPQRGGGCTGHPRGDGRRARTVPYASDPRAQCRTAVHAPVVTRRTVERVMIASLLPIAEMAHKVS